MAYLSTGDVLAERYRIEDEIGRGRYSVVYRATDLTLQTEVALKLLVAPPATEAIARERMRREALVGRGLSHPNVVTLGRLSVRLQVVLSTAIVLGLAAGSTVPVMFLLTPAFAGTVLVAALRRQSRGFLAGSQASPLPPETEAHVRTTLGAMADGAARRLLADFVRMARAVRGSGFEGPADTDDDLDRLVRTATHLARDIESIDASLAVIERQGVRGTGPADEAWTETHTGVSQARDRLVQRLLDALAALARARALGVEAAAAGNRPDLAELARELERETALRAEARREVEELLE